MGQRPGRGSEAASDDGARARASARNRADDGAGSGSDRSASKRTFTGGMAAPRERSEDG